MTAPWRADGPEAKAQRAALACLAEARRGQLEIATHLDPSLRRPDRRLIDSCLFEWTWRPLESEIGTSAPARALSSDMGRRCRPLNMTHLEQISRLSRLECLRLKALSRRNRARGLEHLGRLPALGELHLPGANLELAFVRALPRLRVLVVTSADAELAPLEEAPALADLRLIDAILTPERLRALGRLPRLTTLDLERARGLDDGAPCLARLEGLQRLGLGHTHPSPAILAAVGGLKDLQLLDLNADGLRHPGIDDDGLALLRNLGELRQLDLAGNRRITDAGAETIGRLCALTWLNLACCPITDAGVRHLHALADLRFLELGVSPVSDRALDDLRRAAPGVEIRRMSPAERDEELDRRF